jgi:hypothetical protein
MNLTPILKMNFLLICRELTCTKNSMKMLSPHLDLIKDGLNQSCFVSNEAKKRLLHLTLKQQVIHDCFFIHSI